MSLLERLGWTAVAAWLVFSAHTGWSQLAPLGLAVWFVTLLADDDGADPGPPTLLQVVLLSTMGQALVGAQSWSLAAYGQAAFVAHASYLAALGLGVAVLSRPFATHQDGRVRVAGLTLTWTLVSGVPGSLEGAHPLLLGAMWVDQPGFAQLGAVAGPWGLDALVGLLGACLAELVCARAHLRTRDPYRGIEPLWVACAALTVVGSLGAGRLWLTPTTVFTDADAAPAGAQEIVVVQGAVPGWMQRWSVGDDRLSALSDATYRAATAAALDDSGPAPWLVLPESAIVDILPEGQGAVRAVEEALGLTTPDVTLLTTVSTWEGPEGPRTPWRYRFLAMGTDASGGLDLLAEAPKAVRTPIADSRYVFDRARTTLALGGVTVGPLVCWDAMFATVASDHARAGADVLVATSNDAGFGHTDGPAWHARSARLRAVETGRALVYATQAGPSYVADGLGRVVASLPVNEPGVLRVWVVPAAQPTLYPWVGRAWLVVAGLAWVGLWIAWVVAPAPVWRRSFRLAGARG